MPLYEGSGLGGCDLGGLHVAHASDVDGEWGDREGAGGGAHLPAALPWSPDRVPAITGELFG